MRAVDHRCRPSDPPYPRARPTDGPASFEEGPGGCVVDAPAGTPPRGRPLVEPCASLHRGAASRQAQRLVGRAQWSVGVVLPDRGERASAVGPLVDALAEALGRGLVVRLLCAPGAADEELSRELGRYGALVSVTRVATTGAQAVVIVDGSVVFVPAHGPATMRGPAVVRVFEALFAGAWASAVPLADHDRLRRHTRGEVTRGVLRLLAGGLADDAGAKEMSVSLRTYRRHVAEVLGALGARSRFQAGARAATLGLTPCYGR